jgi:hypothetical protein
MLVQVPSLINVGALTNKVTTFAYRPWELVNVQFRYPNHTISFGNLPTKLMRVLKTTSLNKDDSWITDIERFSIDALSRQRLSQTYYLTNKAKSFYNSHLFTKTAIMGCNINRTLFDLVFHRVDRIQQLHRDSLINIISSYLPFAINFSDIPLNLTDHKYLFLCNSTVFTLDNTLKAKLSRFKSEVNFEFFSFGRNSLPWINNLGITSMFNLIFQHKLNPLYTNLENLCDSTLIIVTDPFTVPVKAIYDYCVSLSISIKVVFVSKEIDTIYRYLPSLDRPSE